MTNFTSKEVQLASFPDGMPNENNFKFHEVSIPEPKDGEFVVKNLWMSVDPYMRGRMMQRESYIAGFEVGKTLEGGAIGQVVASNNDQFPVGAYINSMYGWREYFTSNGTDCTSFEPHEGVPLQAYLGILGMPGLTAYVGLLDIGELKEGDNVFVSAASGAVGAAVCQLAKSRGCYVVGSAGSDEKCKWLEDDCGIDHAINYKTVDDLSSTLREKFPNGIDVYFENVGGEHLTAAIDNMNFFGRIALCGMISQYNATDRPEGPYNIMIAVGKSLKLQGFIVSNHFDRLPAFLNDTATLIKDGKMVWQETVLEGIDQAPQAFFNLFTGGNFGKMLVKLS